MRKNLVVLIVASLFASTAFVSVKQRDRWTEKVDAPLVQAVKADRGESVRALIRVRTGATDQFVAHLSQHGLKRAHVTAPDVVAVDMPASMLRRIALDPDVVHMSSDIAGSVASSF